MATSIAIWHQVNAAIYRFLIVEADVGLTFAKSAITADSTEQCLHDRGVAREAYETAATMIKRTALTGREAKILRRKMLLLNGFLDRLGDPKCKRRNTRSLHR
jgi:hypothetical protein